jgi:hypothetical protein
LELSIAIGVALDCFEFRTDAIAQRLEPELRGLLLGV